MNGLIVARGTNEYEEPWTILRNGENLFHEVSPQNLVEEAYWWLKDEEYDWLLRGYHEWADLKPGEVWLKEAG